MTERCSLRLQPEAVDALAVICGRVKRPPSILMNELIISAYETSPDEHVLITHKYKPVVKWERKV